MQIIQIPRFPKPFPKIADLSVLELVALCTRVVGWYSSFLRTDKALKDKIEIGTPTQRREGLVALRTRVNNGLEKERIRYYELLGKAQKNACDFPYVELLSQTVRDGLTINVHQSMPEHARLQVERSIKAVNNLIPEIKAEVSEPSEQDIPVSVPEPTTEGDQSSLGDEPQGLISKALVRAQAA